VNLNTGTAAAFARRHNYPAAEGTNATAAAADTAYADVNTAGRKRRKETKQLLL